MSGDDWDRRLEMERVAREAREQAAHDAFYDEWRFGRGTLDDCYRAYERVYFGEGE